LICYSTAAETPKSGWKVMRDPAKDGWSPAKLKAALDFATASGSSALMVVEDDKNNLSGKELMIAPDSRISIHPIPPAR
jgi:hypothetical protein